METTIAEILLKFEFLIRKLNIQVIEDSTQFVDNSSVIQSY